MIDVLSVENMRAGDAAAIAGGTPGTELMRRAAGGLFYCAGNEIKDPVAIVCGSGNNAGDGYALALMFKEAGRECTVFTVYDRFSGDGRYWFDKCVEAGVAVEKWSASGQDGPDLSQYATIYDCLLGTGFTGDVRDELKPVINAINESGAYIVSADINSGLDGDTGMAKLCVYSDMTVAIGSFKPGHFLNMAKDVMKDRISHDIGIKPVDEPYKLIEGSDIAGILGKRKNFSNKGTYGYTALVGGSTRYSGAIRLAYLANSAMRSGAGVVKVALPTSIVHDVSQHILERTIFPLSDGYVPEEIDELISNVRTVAFGMGIGTGDAAAAILEHLITKFNGTLIVDADGLNLLSKTDREMLRSAPATLVLTPHIKEFSRLCGLEIAKIQEDPIGNAVRYAKETGSIVLLKGPSTIITDGKRVYLTDRGCPGMATAGSGDVLSGIVAATCSYVEDKTLAVAAAAYINGAAGEKAEERTGAISMIASDTVAAIADLCF